MARLQFNNLGLFFTKFLISLVIATAPVSSSFEEISHLVQGDEATELVCLKTQDGGASESTNHLPDSENDSYHCCSVFCSGIYVATVSGVGFRMELPKYRLMKETTAEHSEWIVPYRPPEV